MTTLKASYENRGWIVGLALIGWFVYKAIDLAWIGDDAFISFRYAKNLIDGNGLVFNIGERVEGYTNFLWTIAIALGLKFGFEPIRFSWFLSILSSVITISLFLYLSVRIYRNDKSEITFFLPLTSIALALQYDFQVWATSGLETATATMFVTAGFVIISLSRLNKSYMVAGLIFALAALTRPDMLIFAATAMAFIFVVEWPEWKKGLYFFTPLILIYLPYWLIRYNYYGYAYPNTYYAKSADLSYFSQGIIYLWLYIQSYYIFLVVPILLVMAIVGLRTKKLLLPTPLIRATGLAILFIPVFILYVIKTGGDFMFARFFIPVTPFLFFIIESFILCWIRAHWIRVTLSVLIIGMVLFRYDLFPNGGSIEGIVDERFYYPSEQIENNRTKGEKLKTYLAGSEARIAYYGAHAMFAYYSEVPIAIEADAGLTDEYVAHMPLKERGRIGHEKKAPMKYLYERGVNFFFKTTHNTSQKFNQYRLISFGDYKSFIFTYNNVLMNHLKQFDDVKFTDFSIFLDNYIEQLDRIPKEQLKQDYEFFRFYYFSINNDSDRENKIKAALQ